MCYSGQENLLTPKKSLLVLNAGTALIYWSVYESVWQECPLAAKAKRPPAIFITAERSSIKFPRGGPLPSVRGRSALDFEDQEK